VSPLCGLADGGDGVGRDLAEHDRTGEHALDEREHLADGRLSDAVAAELVGEPDDHGGRDAPQLVLAEPGQDVVVPGAGVIVERVPGEVGAGVGAEPVPRPLVERLAPRLELRQLAELLAPADVGLEADRVLVTVEGADVLAGPAACVAPADAVDAAPVLERALLDHSWITSFQSERGHGLSLPSSSAGCYSASSSSRSLRPGPFRLVGGRRRGRFAATGVATVPP
jgi:hypothetical protein